MSVETVGGRYALEGRLGEGGMGCVYRVRHLQLGKAFALKVISPAFALDTAARERFNEEAKLASEITHPNIVSVVDFGEDIQFGAYMVMELVEGEALLGEGGPMSIRRACDVLTQIADALDHIHRRGIVHGDVKADNIMLTAEATAARRRRIARLLDFGLARRNTRAQEPEVAPEISGSPHYLAPERTAGGLPTVATDVYALGVLGYLMLSGTLPFSGNVVELLLAHVSATPESITARRNEPVDEALESLIARAMAKDPASRHASAAAFRYELDNVMDMLDLRRRDSGPLTRAEASASASRESILVAAFDRSRVPQALLAVDGTIVFANKAFVALLGDDRERGSAGRNLADTTLAVAVPGLMRGIGAVHVAGKPQERRARVHRDDKAPLDLTVWICPLPLPGQEIHMMVRVEEVDPRLAND